MKKVLVVDDSAFVRLSIKTMLEKNECIVVGEAEDGITAIDMYNKYRPDLVTLDLTMPGLDGIETLKLLKSIDENARIIMISSLGQEAKVTEAIKFGAIAFLIKPFQDEMVLKVLH